MTAGSTECMINPCLLLVGFGPKKPVSLITPIISMTAMLLQVFGHKADLGDLLRENAKVRGIFSCLEMSGAAHLARVTVAGYISAVRYESHSAFSCRPITLADCLRAKMFQMLRGFAIIFFHRTKFVCLCVFN